MFNSQKSTNEIDYISRLERKSHTTISIDAEKAHRILLLRIMLTLKTSQPRRKVSGSPKEKVCAKQLPSAPHLAMRLQRQRWRGHRHKRGTLTTTTVPTGRQRPSQSTREGTEVRRGQRYLHHPVLQPEDTGRGGERGVAGTQASCTAARST